MMMNTVALIYNQSVGKDCQLINHPLAFNCMRVYCVRNRSARVESSVSLAL